MANWRLLGVLLGAWVLLSARTAQAYPWMIRHDYPACAQCHVDPSGGGPLTEYGRGMGVVLLPTQYGAAPSEEQEPGRAAKFLWGLVPLPKALDLGGSLRGMSLSQKIEDTGLTRRLILMQADLTGTLQAERWVVSGSVGYEPSGGLFAAVSRGTTENIVSRFHWVGFRLDQESKTMLRAGRMNLPFGIRDVLHTLVVRTSTRTNIDDQQQHGLAFSYSGQELRAEVMGILGNFQIRPDAYRERGYAGYAEWIPNTQLAVGASSRITHVDLDRQQLVPAWRHAHGVFGRWATPFRSLVLMAEADYVVDSYRERPRTQGVASMAQADFEVVQGIHYQLTGEAWDVGPHGSDPSFSVWGSFLWFALPHVDLRLDAIHQSLTSLAGRTNDELLLAQAHLYL